MNQCITVQISESKAIVKQYLKTPLSKIPANDRERFNIALMVVQTALGRKRFQDFLKGIEE